MTGSRRLMHVFLLLFTLLLSSPLALAQDAAHTYMLAPGDTTITLTVPDEGDSYILTFAGPPSVQVIRVVTGSGVDITFAGADPKDASDYFRNHPIWLNDADDGKVTILVRNATDRDLHLTITAQIR